LHPRPFFETFTSSVLLKPELVPPISMRLLGNDISSPPQPSRFPFVTPRVSGFRPLASVLRLSVRKRLLWWALSAGAVLCAAKNFPGPSSHQTLPCGPLGRPLPSAFFICRISQSAGSLRLQRRLFFSLNLVEFSSYLFPHFLFPSFPKSPLVCHLLSLDFTMTPASTLSH